MAAVYPYPPVDPSDLAQQAAARARTGVSDLAWTADSHSVVFSYRGDVFEVSPDGTNLRRLTTDGGGRSRLACSPDGRFLSYLQGGDLWLWDRQTEDLLRATSVGMPPIGNVPGGRYHRNDVEFTSYAWSPDSRSIALEYDDRRNVRKILFPNHLGEATSVESLRRDFPGDQDFIRKVAIYSVAKGRFSFLDLPEPTDRRLTGYWWSPDGRSLLVDQSSEDAVDRWLYVADPNDLSLRQIWHDSHERRTTRHWVSAWDNKGQGVLTVSDRDGQFRLWTQPLGGSAPRRLTEGDWSIVGHRGASPLTVDARSGDIFFVSTQKSPHERQVYRMPVRGGSVRQVTTLPGTHEPFLSPDGATLAILHASDLAPPELYLLDLTTGGAERRVTTSPPEDFRRYSWIAPRYVTFKSRVDGYMLHGRIIEPPNLDRTRKHPLILGPVYSNTARNDWDGLFGLLVQYLAQERGYLNLQVDIRGSVGYGRDFMNEFLGDYGGGDLEDLHSGVEYMLALGYVDSSRVGIWGSSYGGTLTAGSLFRKPGVYKAGVAAAPAIRVPFFTTNDVRVAGRPNTHPRVFREQSMYNHAAGLQDHLLIIHGMQDDVVLFRDSIALIERLMLMGKDFDLAIAPSAVHGWAQKDYYARYLLGRLVDHFDRYIGGGPTPARPPTAPGTAREN